MNALLLGLPFAQDYSSLHLYRSQCGHAIRTLACLGADNESQADYTFAPEETAAEVLARIGNDWQPDVLICWLPEYFPPPLEVEACPIKTAALVSDWNLFYSQLEFNLARYDVALTDKLGAQSLAVRGATPQHLFPLYAQSTPVHRKMDLAKDIDILFAGNLNHAIHVQRARYLEPLATLSEQYRVVICGGRYGDDYTRLLNRARIVFNHSVRREMNLRCFETLACGSLLFLEEDNLEVRDWLRDREEVVLYRPDNFLKLLCHYLESPAELERIARQGHAKASPLAGENRLDVLLDWLDAQPHGPRPFTRLSQPQQSYATIVQYAASLVSAQRPVAETQLARALDQWPDRPEFLTLQGTFALERLSTPGRSELQLGPRNVITPFERAPSLAPSAAVCWLNLAFVCGMGKAQQAQATCLERALVAATCDYGGLLLSPAHDPYYYAWRRALALGQAPVEILWAMAATRLARVRLEQGRHEEARDRAAQSLAWLPGIAIPHRIRALAESRMGHGQAAAEILADALELTAFDWEYRLDLVRAWQAIGQTKKARAVLEDSVRLFSVCPHEAGALEAFRQALAEMG